mmetsp:Transcript_13910/g.28700  ORF Transcript_13910/g.28700 Transcript_13910/m.28700 type:complete len:203 (-) Transcript_13910:219-827(-)
MVDLNIGFVRYNVRAHGLVVVVLRSIGLQAHALHPRIGIPDGHDRQRVGMDHAIELWLSRVVFAAIPKGNMFPPRNLVPHLPFGFQVGEIAVVVNQGAQEIRPGIEHARGSHVPILWMGLVAEDRAGLQSQNFGRAIHGSYRRPFRQERSIHLFAVLGNVVATLAQNSQNGFQVLVGSNVVTFVALGSCCRKIHGFVEDRYG